MKSYSIKKSISLTIILALVAIVLCLCFSACDTDEIGRLTNEVGFIIEGGGFEEGAVLEASVIAEDSDEGIAALDAISGQEYNVFKPVYIFDVSVVKDNAKVQPDGKVKVSIPVNANLATYKAILHIKDDGTVEKLSATYADGMVSFETDSFSIFVLVEPVVTNIHTHNFSREWSQSETHHWHECLSENCLAQQDLAEHYYDEHGWSVEKSATETEEGVKVRVCIGCKHEDRESIPKLSHVHTYSSDWTSDGTDHWHAATCAHPTEKSDVAQCSGGSASCTQKAVCAICDNEYGDLLPHNFTAQVRTEAYLAIPATCLSHATYYYSCSACGKKGTETFEDTYGKLAYCSYDSTEICTVCEIPAGDWLTFSLRDDRESYKVTGVKNVNGRTAKSILVPNTYEGKPVVEISDGALYNYDVQHIILSDNVKILGEKCTLSPHLETLTIGKGLQSIKEGSFGYGNGAGECLRQITIADDNPYFKVVDNILYSKDGKTLVKYPAKREGTEFTIDSTVEKIWGYAFENTQNLKNVVIPNNVTEISGWAFSLSSVTSVDIGTGVQTIPEYAFASSMLSSVDLDDNIKTIHDRAFYCCSKLKTVNFGSKVTTIGFGAFETSALTEIIIPDNVRSLGTHAFATTNDVTNVVIGTGIEDIPNNAFESSAINTVNPTLTIGSNVKTIGIKAFSGMNITGVTIPASVKSIGHSAFMNCTKLVSIVIPNTVESLDVGCFQDCKALESVTLGNQLTEIPNSAFYRCQKLASITLPNSVKTIGDGAFFGCIKLDTINFGTRLTSIGEGAFENCSALESLTLPSGLEEIMHNAFEGCSALTTVVLPTSINKISNVAFTSCDALTSITFDSTTDKELYFNYSGVYTYTFDTVEKTIAMLSSGPIGQRNYLYSLARYNEAYSYAPITADTTVTRWEDRATA